MLEKTPLELAFAIIDRGLALVRGALLRRLDQLMTKETGVAVLAYREYYMLRVPSRERAAVTAE